MPAKRALAKRVQQISNHMRGQATWFFLNDVNLTERLLEERRSASSRRRSGHIRIQNGEATFWTLHSGRESALERIL